MIPKGHIFYCPTCGKPLYRVDSDIQITDPINESIGRVIAIYPQNLISHASNVIQTCNYCRNDYNILQLIKTYWTGS